jgi:hypothetical protein
MDAQGNWHKTSAFCNRTGCTERIGILLNLLG